MTDTCHLCYADLSAAPVVGTLSRHGHASRRVACAQCGLVQVSPQPSEATLALYYESGAYRREYGPLPQRAPSPDGGWIAPDHVMYPEMQRRVGEGYASLVANHTAGRDVIDVGCGEGHLVAALSRRGYRVTAIESDRDLSAPLVQLPGVTLYNEPWDRCRSAPVADCVVMLHSLEHFHDPRLALMCARAKLRSSGCLIIEVPNVLHPYGPLDLWYFQHVHLFDFSASTLSCLLEQTGFRVHEVRETEKVLLAIAEPSRTPIDAKPPKHQPGQWVAGYLARYRAEHEEHEEGTRDRSD